MTAIAEGVMAAAQRHFLKCPIHGLAGQRFLNNTNIQAIEIRNKNKLLPTTLLKQIKQVIQVEKLQVCG